MLTRNEIFHIYICLKILLFSNTVQTLFEVAIRCREMKRIPHMAMFSAKLLILFWILDAFLVAQNFSVLILQSRHEHFPDIIRRSKFAFVHLFRKVSANTFVLAMETLKGQLYTHYTCCRLETSKFR